MSIDKNISLPLEPCLPPEVDDKRLWIGNIDSRLTEYNLLKIVQQFGSIKKFDFLFHKTGPLKGQPRGYCFVTYEKRDQAEKALETLNGKLSMGKNLVVKWASPSDSLSQKKTDKIQTHCEIEDTKKVISTNHQIKAIEAKLKAMQEQHERDLEMSLLSAPEIADSSFVFNKKYSSNQKQRHTPYHRKDLCKR